LKPCVAWSVVAAGSDAVELTRFLYQELSTHSLQTQGKKDEKLLSLLQELVVAAADGNTASIMFTKLNDQCKAITSKLRTDILSGKLGPCYELFRVDVFRYVNAEVLACM
jgi:hypothetical protein